MQEGAVPQDLQPMHRLEIMSFAEASTLLLLCLAVPLKHLGDWPLGVSVLGPVHGLAFFAFAWTAIETIATVPHAWRPMERARLLLGAFVPFGGFLNMAMIRRKTRKTDRADARGPAR